VAVLQFGKLQTQEGMASDQFISTHTDGRWLFWGNGNRVIRYDTFSANHMEIWNQSGFVNGSAIPEEYTLIMGLNFIQTLTPVALADGSGFVEDMTVTTDPIIEAPVPEVIGNLPRTGKTWLYKASASAIPENCTPTAADPMSCVVTSLIGNDNPPNPSPAHDAAKRAVLLISGITHPRGLVWLQSNWWVSDENQGFCRIDQNPVTGAAALSNCFQPTAAFIPGQPAATPPDPANLNRQTVFVPDASPGSRGISRLVFTPDATGGSVSETGVLNAGPGTPYTVALPNGPHNDGALYIGYSDQGKIKKISTPLTAPSGVTDVGGLANSVGAISMGFNGNDLYISELGPPPIFDGQLIKKGQVSVLQAASPSLIKGNAQPVKRAISRLFAKPGILLINPGGFAVGPATERPACLPPPGVHLSPRVPADPTTTPALYLGSLGLPSASAVTGGPGQAPEVDQYDFICTTQNPWVLQGALDANLSVNVDLGSVTALALDSNQPNAILAVGDDPSVIVPTQTAQKSKIIAPGTGAIGQGHVYLVQ
jgi:hypothetical protein